MRRRNLPAASGVAKLRTLPRARPAASRRHSRWAWASVKGFLQRNDRRNPTRPTLQNDFLTLDCCVDELPELLPGLIDRRCSHVGTITHSGSSGKQFASR